MNNAAYLIKNALRRPRLPSSAEEVSRLQSKENDIDDVVASKAQNARRLLSKYTKTSSLLKQAIPDPMKFVMEHPFSDRRPQVRDGYEQRQVASELYSKLNPLYKRTVDARLRGRQLVSTGLH